MAKEWEITQKLEKHVRHLSLDCHRQISFSPPVMLLINFKFSVKFMVLKNNFCCEYFNWVPKWNRVKWAKRGELNPSPARFMDDTIYQTRSEKVEHVSRWNLLCELVEHFWNMFGAMNTIYGFALRKFCCIKLFPSESCFPKNLCCSFICFCAK